MNKKILCILSALLCLAVASCQKDNEPVAPEPEPEPQPAPEPQPVPFTMPEVHLLDRIIEADEVPDLPLVYIVTQDSVWPTCDYVLPPEGGIGMSITNNEYVNGKMQIVENSYVSYDSGDFIENASGMKIRLRGNGSAYFDKKPYKIYLEKKNNLLSDCDGTTPDHDYLLIPDNQAKQFVGNTVAAAVGLEWQPKCKYVNVIINDSYEGLYVLTESVKRGGSRVNVEESGLIMENDAYYWNNETYFQTDNLAFGYTFKYPKEENLTDDVIQPIKNHITEFETYLFSGSDVCFEYIDSITFARWLLCHDYLGNGDPCGSNMYLYSRRFFDTGGSSKENKRLYMGPAWDFDGIYETGGSWAYIRLHKRVFYYTELVKFDKFKRAYITEFDKTKGDISFAVANMFDKMIQENGEAINESRTLDAERWTVSSTTIEDIRDYASKWFSSRVVWMESQVDSEMR